MQINEINRFKNKACIGIVFLIMNAINNLVFPAVIGALWLCISSCQSENNSKNEIQRVTVSSTNNDWNNYWYAGKAEVNSYKLNQSRYGQQREGTSMLIFVTEDFSKAKHVKLDNPSHNPSDKVSVLKTNMMRKFNTGIYDYSMMASIFTPISLDKYPHTLKATSSSQEWCGHTWTQYNRVEDGYKIDVNSYFESEGDETSKLKSEWLEDELWNRIRINPEDIPMGKLKIIPSSFYSRLTHLPIRVEDAVISKQKNKEGTTFSLRYLTINRSLEISIDNKPPFKITTWKETSPKGTTSGTLIKSLHIPYWQMNDNQFETYRDSLMIN